MWVRITCIMYLQYILECTKTVQHIGCSSRELVVVPQAYGIFLTLISTMYLISL